MLSSTEQGHEAAHSWPVRKGFTPPSPCVYSAFRDCCEEAVPVLELVVSGFQIVLGFP